MTITTSGIIQPLTKYRFRVIFGNEHIYEEQMILTQQVIKCSIDITNNIFKISLRQPIVANVINVLKFIIKRHTNTIYVEPMDTGNNGALFSIEMTECKCIEHDFELDYSSSDVATHNLVFEFSNIREIQPVDWEALVKELNSITNTE